MPDQKMTDRKTLVQGHYVRARHGFTTVRGRVVPVTDLAGPFDGVADAADYIARIFETPSAVEKVPVQ